MTAQSWAGRTRHRVALVVGAAAFAAVLVVLFLFDPAAGGLFPPCPLRWATGWLCPGCGGLRGAHALLHGDVAAAWRLNPLLLTLVPALGAMVMWEALRTWGLPLRPLRLPRAVPWIVLVLVVAFGVLRNVLAADGAV